MYFMLLEALDLFISSKKIIKSLGTGTNRVPSRIERDWERSKVNAQKEENCMCTVIPGSVTVTADGPVDVKVTKSSNGSVTYSFSFS